MSTSRLLSPRIAAVCVLAGLLIITFCALGVWQIERRAWKLNLIASVDARVDMAPVPAPGPEAWPQINAEDDEYRHVTLTGHFLNDMETQIYSPTMLGPGYWVLTPLARDDGTFVMVNRGFVPENYKAPSTRKPPEGEVTVTGLLRISESKGWLFSRANDPEHKTWYRRDIGSITKTFGLDPAAPYFVDADAGADPDAWPRGGLTVVSFRNAHLSYAITWFALAILTAIMLAVVISLERQQKDGETIDQD